MRSGPKQIEGGRIVRHFRHSVAVEQFRQQLGLGLQHFVRHVKLVGRFGLHEKVGGVGERRASEEEDRVAGAELAAQEPRVRRVERFVGDHFAGLSFMFIESLKMDQIVA